MAVQALKHSRLSFRVLMYTAISGAFFVLLVTAGLLYRSYLDDLKAIDKAMDFIRDSQVPGIAASVYSLNEEHLRIYLEGTLNIRDIAYLEVVEQRGDEEIRTGYGSPDVARKIIREYELNYRGPAGEIAYGTLIVVASIDDVLERLWSDGLRFLFASAIVIGLVTVTIFLIIQLMLTRHLTVLAKFANKLNLNELDHELALDHEFPKSFRRDELGQLVNAILQMRDRIRLDILERKRNEKRLRQFQKMEVVGQLTGGIAHDFNNMLGVIMGNLELLRCKLTDDPKAMKNLEAAYRGGERGASITKKLLGFSRNEGGNPQLTNMNEFIADMENLISKALMPKINVKTHLADDVWFAKIDPGDLEDSLLNLSLNARDAMPDGGSLLIETANKILDEDYVRQNPESTEGEHVMISVSDTGIGMTPDVVEKALQPFFSTKEKAKGTGLGLSMVYGFAQRSGGHLKIHSEPGKGTTIRIFMPRAVEGIDDAKEINTDIDIGLQSGNETVLVVDDEEGLLEVAVSHLESLGYRTLSAASGRQALEVLQEHPQIDLLFSDVVMPGSMDGFSLAQEALKSCSGIKVLLASGFSLNREGTEEDDNSLYEKLSRNLLAKPYNRSELAKAVRRTLDEGDST